MLNPRWKKVAGDLIGNPTRTILVVLSIFIGVFAVGLITSSQAIIVREMRDSYIEANPANATLSLSDEDSFDDDLLQTIRNMHEVGEADARRIYSVQALSQLNEWRDMRFAAIEDFEEVHIDKFTLVRGTWPPGDKEVLIERSGIPLLGKDVGDTILVERPDGKQRRLRIAGIVYGATELPANWAGILGYIDVDTMEWISGETGFNQLLILSAEDSNNRDHNEAVAEAVYDKIQKSGRDPSFPMVPTPNEHPLEQFIGGMVAIMSLMGVLSVFLSGFLVTNTISALLAQQIKQIGIMKSVGAKASQIIGMYLVLVLCFGMLALLLAYPLVQFAARGFASAIAGQFNFDLRNFNIPWQVIAIQVMISLGVPVLAALYPIIAGTRVTIREALSTEGGAGNYGASVIDRMIQRVQGLPRPVLLSLRNTFRRKGRVTLTLMTLTLGGSIFIAIFSVRSSLRLTLDDILDSLFNYDVEVAFDRSYRDDYLISEALRVPGVTAAESWRVTGVRRMLPGNRESDTITLWGIPPASQMTRPTLIQGRWLLPNDQQAIVLSNGILDDETDIELGDEIVLNVNGRDTTWRVVGEVVTIGSERWAYVPYDSFGRATQDVGAAGSLQVQTQQHTRPFQEQVAANLDEHFSRLGVNVTSTMTMSTIRETQDAFFDVIIFGLLIMSMLIAVVGGLGLAGTMSLNVIERIREIGVMRAIGASDTAVLQVVMIEGIVLGGMSWLFGSLLSFPISKLLCEQVGLQLFSFPLAFSFSVEGAVIWLVISLVLASVASFLPAWRASRVTVRDVLAYE